METSGKSQNDCGLNKGGNPNGHLFTAYEIAGRAGGGEGYIHYPI